MSDRWGSRECNGSFAGNPDKDIPLGFDLCFLTLCAEAISESAHLPYLAAFSKHKKRTMVQSKCGHSLLG